MHNTVYFHSQTKRIHLMCALHLNLVVIGGDSQGGYAGLGGGGGGECPSPNEMKHA